MIHQAIVYAERCLGTRWFRVGCMTPRGTSELAPAGCSRYLLFQTSPQFPRIHPGIEPLVSLFTTCSSLDVLTEIPL